MAKFLIILFILHSTTAIEAQWDNSTSEEITNSTTTTLVSQPSMTSTAKNFINSLLYGLITGIKLLLTPVMILLVTLLNIVETLLGGVMLLLTITSKTLLGVLGLSSVASMLVDLLVEIQDMVNNTLKTINNILSQLSIT
ncbi:uncharacterized protein LOC103569397 [Microplitis demolitor]|uniref:uncharacterized protein LOC103569397 n=1 Tax=Microplitis demolitor TaxID=69319 RepID=UPI0004CDA9DA|nr:uncharacterized protein LOC103569397 [Microplitis demolitor]